MWNPSTKCLTILILSLPGISCFVCTYTAAATKLIKPETKSEEPSKKKEDEKKTDDKKDAAEETKKTDVDQKKEEKEDVKKEEETKGGGLSDGFAVAVLKLIGSMDGAGGEIITLRPRLSVYSSRTSALEATDMIRYEGDKDILNTEMVSDNNYKNNDKNHVWCLVFSDQGLSFSFFFSFLLPIPSNMHPL